jgi:hypothetical protein
MLFGAENMSSGCVSRNRAAPGAAPPLPPGDWGVWGTRHGCRGDSRFHNERGGCSMF